jgi:hypothetical protein
MRLMRVEHLMILLSIATNGYCHFEPVIHPAFRCYPTNHQFLQVPEPLTAHVNNQLPSMDVITSGGS